MVLFMVLAAMGGSGGNIPAPTSLGAGANDFERNGRAANNCRLIITNASGAIYGGGGGGQRQMRLITADGTNGCTAAGQGGGQGYQTAWALAAMDLNNGITGQKVGSR
jgi:hypothetical protein